MRVIIEVTARYEVDVDAASADAARRAVEGNWDVIYKHLARPQTFPVLSAPTTTFRVVDVQPR